MIRLRSEIEDALAESLEESFCEMSGCSPWSILRVNKDTPYQLFGYFESEAEAQRAWEALREDFPTLHKDPERTQIDDEDWKNAYKAFLKPWSERGLHWVPVWMRDEYSVPEGEVCVWFDAGMAFGTGSHETTRLCAGRLLDFRDSKGQEAFANARVLDAGCGSGILAISAVLLGAKNVFGFDRDPEAARVSVQNAQGNIAQQAKRPEFAEQDLEGALAGRQADLVLANIQADVLMIHAEALVTCISPDGWLVLSGVLVVECDRVYERFSQAWEKAFGASAHYDSRVMGEWCDLLFYAQ